MTSFESIFSSLENVQLLVFAAALAMARMLGMMILMALFTRIRMTGLLRNAVALAFSIPLLPALLDMVRQDDLTAAMIVALGFKEMLIGATLGFAMSVPFLAAEAAGDILDLQRGVTMGVLVDPMMTRETSASGTLFGIVIVTIFISAGGVLTVIDAVYNSYDIWPVDRFSPIFSAESASILLNILTRILIMALALAFPIIIAMLLSDVILAFISRSSPHLNIFALSLVSKAFIYTLLIILYASFMLFYMTDNLSFFGEMSQLLHDVGCRDC